MWKSHEAMIFAAAVAVTMVMLAVIVITGAYAR